MELDRQHRLTLLMGIGLGAALMFVLDPDRGARRRALVRDKSVKLLRRGGRTVRDRSVDIGNRIGGTAAEVRAKLKPPPTDIQIEASVRAELGHNVEHPKAIEVVVDGGNVILRGNVLQEELDDVLSTVRGVRGVRDVLSELEVQVTPGDTPSLQD